MVAASNVFYTGISMVGRIDIVNTAPSFAEYDKNMDLVEMTYISTL